MKTGNTRWHIIRIDIEEAASMEPGHEDREYTAALASTGLAWHSLNGARS